MKQAIDSMHRIVKDCFTNLALAHTGPVATWMCCLHRGEEPNDTLGTTAAECVEDIGVALVDLYPDEADSTMQVMKPIHDYITMVQASHSCTSKDQIVKAIGRLQAFDFPVCQLPAASKINQSLADMQCHEQEKLKVGIVCSITRLTAMLRGEFDHHVQQMLNTLCYNGKLCDFVDGLQSPDLDKHKYMQALMPITWKLSKLHDSIWHRLELCQDLLSYKHIPI